MTEKEDQSHMLPNKGIYLTAAVMLIFHHFSHAVCHKRDLLPSKVSLGTHLSPPWQERITKFHCYLPEDPFHKPEYSHSPPMRCSSL